MSIPWISGLARNASVIRSPIFRYHSWAAISIRRSNRRALCPPIRCFEGTRDWRFLITSMRFPRRIPRVASDRSITSSPYTSFSASISWRGSV